MMDTVARTIAWYGVYLHQLDAQVRAGISQTAAEAEAARVARHTISRTQPGARAFQLPELYRSHEFLNAVLQFTNQINKLWNMASYDTRALWANAEYRRLFATVSALGLNAVLIWSLTSRRLPEDPEEVAEAIVEQGVNSVPMLGPAIVSAARGFGGGQLPAIEGAAQLAAELRRTWAAGGIETPDARTLERIYRDIAPVVGVPYTGPRNIVRFATTGRPTELLGGPPKTSKSRKRTRK